MTGKLRRLMFAGLAALTLGAGTAATVEPAAAWGWHHHGYWGHHGGPRVGFYGPGYCGVRRVWVPGPWGWHWAWARRCW